MEAELELLAEERIQLILEDKQTKGDLRQMRRIFEEEAVKPDNSKVEGQTVRSGMEGVMKDNRIEFGSFRAGDIQWNGCQKLRGFGGEITKYMTQFLHSMPAGHKYFNKEEIDELFGVYYWLSAIFRPYFKLFARNSFI